MLMLYADGSILSLQWKQFFTISLSAVKAVLDPRQLGKWVYKSIVAESSVFILN